MNNAHFLTVQLIIWRQHLFSALVNCRTRLKVYISLEHFTLWVFNGKKYLWGPLKWEFLPVTLPLGHLHLFRQNHFPHLYQKGHLHWVPLAADLNLSNGSRVRIPRVSYFFYNSTHVRFEFHFHVIIFHFFATLSSFLANSLSVIHFCKCQVRIQLEDQETTQHSLWITELTDVQWPITDTLWKREVIVTDDYEHVLFASDLWTEELAGKFVLYAITHIIY